MLYPVHFVYVSVGLAEIERGCRLMIRFDKVSFNYQESLQNGGLRDVDLTINKGECVLLCGRSGCGKTTLTRLVNGLIPYFYPGAVSYTHLFTPGSNRAKYCPECAARMKRINAAKRKRKQREKCHALGAEKPL